MLLMSLKRCEFRPPHRCSFAAFFTMYSVYTWVLFIVQFAMIARTVRTQGKFQLFKYLAHVTKVQFLSVKFGR